jgi:N-acetylneuraminic acid mutarotase
MVARRLLSVALAVTAVVLVPAIIQADGPIGRWLPGPPMIRPHDSHITVVLKDGRLLVVGLKAELYDPLANSWSPTGNQGIGRSQQTATLLGDGRVLVAGGIDGTTGRSVPNAELYDPKTNAWSPAASMAGRRYAHTATLLKDGRVLIVGGTRSAVDLDSTEIYDPTADRWSPGPTLPTPRSGHSASILADGRVLLAGGEDGTGPTLASALFFDPTASRWSSTNQMTTGRHSFAMMPLKDGRVMAVAGLPGPGPQPGFAAEIFDPARDRWSVAGSDTQPLLTYGLASARLEDGRVFVSGGPSQTYMGDALDTGFLYDPTTDRWFTTNPMKQGRVDPTASLLPDGRVLVAGGRTAQTNGTPLDTTEIFDPGAAVATSPSTAAATAPASSSAAGSLQRLASQLPLVPLLTGGLGVIALAVLTTIIVRRGRHPRRRRRSL